MSSDTIQTSASARYYARVVDEKVVSRDDWSSDLAGNVFAIFLGCFIDTHLVEFATSIIDYILLNNFPEISRYLCNTEKGWKQCRLYWVQDTLQAALCVIVMLMRWPGWKWLHLHLWQCIIYGMLALTVVESCMVMALVALQVYLRTGDYLAWWTGWDPLLVNEKREEHMVNPRLGPPAALAGQVFTNTDSNGVLREVTAWTTYPIKSTPGSAWKLRKQKAELATALSQDHGEQHQHLRPSSTGLAPSTAPGHSAMAKDDIAGVVGSSSSIFPEWMRGRSFGDSIFGSSLASSQSRNSPCPSSEDVAISMTVKDGKDQVASSSGFRMPDLLTGSPIRSRKFL